MKGHFWTADPEPAEIIVTLTTDLKGWFTAFFLCMIVFMGCNIKCLHVCLFLKSLIFHKFPLYCKPLSPLSFERPVDYGTTPPETGNGLRLVSLGWCVVIG